MGLVDGKSETETPRDDDKKKGREIDLSFEPTSVDGSKIFDTKPKLDANGNEIFRVDGLALVEEYGNAKTMLDFCLRSLKTPIEADKDKGIEDLRKSIRICQRLEKYGDRPISLKSDNWNFIRERMLKNMHRCIVMQFDLLVEGEPSDEELLSL